MDKNRDYVKDLEELKTKHEKQIGELLVQISLLHHELELLKNKP